MRKHADIITKTIRSYKAVSVIAVIVIGLLYFKGTTINLGPTASDKDDPVSIVSAPVVSAPIVSAMKADRGKAGIDQSSKYIESYMAKFIMEKGFGRDNIELAEILSNNGYKDLALHTYIQAISESSGNIVYPLISAGMMLEDLGEPDKFRSLALDAISRHPNDIDVYSSLAEFYMERNMLNESANILQVGMYYNADREDYQSLYNNYQEFIINYNAEYSDIDNEGTASEQRL